MSNEIGCTWVIGRTHKYDAKRKTYSYVNIHCNKLPAANDCFCPKHRRLAAELGEQQNKTHMQDRPHNSY